MEVEREPLLSGPTLHYEVLLHGKVLPGVNGWPTEDGRIGLAVGNLTATFDLDVAREVVALLAQALAISAGYKNAWATTKDHPFVWRTPAPASMTAEHFADQLAIHNGLAQAAKD